MAKLPDKFSIAKPVVVDAVNGHPVRPVDVNGIALDDATVQFSVAHPVVEVDATGTVIADSTRVFSMAKRVRISPTGTPIIVTDPTGVTTGGTLTGGGSLSPTFNTTFGTTDTSTGRITFPLKAGCRRIYAGAGGLDTNDGLSHATRVLTLGKAAQIYNNASKLPGDQLMLAQGSTFTDDGLNGIFEFDGFSTLYPNVVMSYDPSDPTNATKFGYNTATAQPIVTLDPSLVSNPRGAANFSSSHNYHFVQGITFTALDTASGTLSVGTIGTNRTGIGYQNCRFQKVGCYFDVDETSTLGNWGSTFLISQCSGYGQWRNDGNQSWLYISGTDSFCIEDCVGAHNGWKMDVPRETALASGGPYYLGHGIYLAAENTNVIVRRVIGIDPAQDMFSLRGSWTGSCFVSLDAPIFNTFGGYSGGPTEWPQGSLCKLTDFSVFGGANINTTTGQFDGIGFGVRNTVSGSFITNGALADNPIFLGVNNYYLSANNDVATLSVAALVNNVRGYKFANYSGQVSPPNGGSNAAGISITWTNCITDVAAPGGSNSAYGSQPAGYKDRAALYSYLGFTADATLGKAQLANWLLCYPHLAGQFALAIDTIGLQALGLSPTTHSVTSVPSLTGLSAPPTVYDTTAPALTLPTTASITSSGVTIGATTSKGTGRLYYVITTSATAPTKDAIRNGLYGDTTFIPVASGFLDISSTGAKTIAVTGLNPSTAYYAHMMQENSSGVQSNISTTSQFTTSAGSSFATFDPATVASGTTLSNVNLTATTAGGSATGAKSTKSVTAGAKVYAEFHIDTLVDAATFGVIDSSATFTPAFWFNTASTHTASATPGVGMRYNTTTGSCTGGSGSTVGIAYNDTTKKFYVSIGGVWQNSSDPVAGTGGIDVTGIGSTLFLAFQGDSGDKCTANFGASAFAFTPPTGYGTL